MTGHRLAILFVMIFSALQTGAQNPSGRIEAKYLFSYGPPGSPIELSQPQQIRYDQNSSEIYVCDTGHNRIVILDSLGLYLFEFSNADVMRSPTDAAVDSEGRIYVLGSTHPESPVNIFDYNGEFLRPLSFQSGPEASSLAITSMVMDRTNRLHLLDESGARILSYNCLGEFVSEIALMPDATAEERGKQVWGKLGLAGDDLLLPAPIDGTVYCYGSDGTLIRSFGNRGDGYGELSHPIAAAADGQRNIYVLDKHKGLIISFSETSDVNQELCGYGLKAGYLYHPIALMADNAGRLWVAQGYNDRIQVFLTAALPVIDSSPSDQPIVVDN